MTYILRKISSASSYFPEDKRYLGDSGNSRSNPVTTNDGTAQINRKIRQELYVNETLVKPISLGMINHAKPVGQKIKLANILMYSRLINKILKLF